MQSYGTGYIRTLQEIEYRISAIMFLIKVYINRVILCNHVSQI